MKLLTFFPHKLKAASGRRASQRASEDTEEPNMKLTSAFAVVLVLHVVAVGGIYAFNSIKAHKTPGPESTRVRKTASVPLPPADGTAKMHQVKSGETLARIAATYGVTIADIEAANGLGNVGAVRVGQHLKIPQKVENIPALAMKQGAAPLKTAHTTQPRDSGKIYTVGKGESPAAIARKLGVNYDDLLKLNKVEDPKKLQIGQKLRVPSKAKL